MKISDKELRECASDEYNDTEQELASELLQRRREVRRLRKAMNEILNYAPTTLIASIAATALKPKRGTK